MYDLLTYAYNLYNLEMHCINWIKTRPARPNLVLLHRFQKLSHFSFSDNHWFGWHSKGGRVLKKDNNKSYVFLYSSSCDDALKIEIFINFSQIRRFLSHWNKWDYFKFILHFFYINCLADNVNKTPKFNISENIMHKASLKHIWWHA